MISNISGKSWTPNIIAKMLDGFNSKLIGRITLK
jgi:hypothetical protein